MHAAYCSSNMLYRRIKSATVAVNLQAGTFYYYEVLQLSSDQMNTLSFNFTMTCPGGSEICTSKPIESSYLQHKIPRMYC